VIYFVRHGEVDGNRTFLRGVTNSHGINERGREQAKRARDFFITNKIKIDYCFVSPLKRAQETARIIYDGKIVTDDRLVERDFGKHEGKRRHDTTDPDISHDDYYNLFKLEKQDEVTPHGVEHLLMVEARMHGFIEEMKTRYKGKNILVVAHGGIGAHAKSYLIGRPKDGDYHAYDYHIDNCGIVEIDNG